MGQVVTEKSYPELCNDNYINIAYDTWYDDYFDMVKQADGTLSIAPSPSLGFYEGRTNIPHNGQIFQSFLDLCRIGYFTFKHNPSSFENGESQLLVGPFQCNDFQKHHGHFIKCLPPHSHAAWYLFTKEGFKQKNKIRFCY